MATIRPFTLLIRGAALALLLPAAPTLYAAGPVRSADVSGQTESPTPAPRLKYRKANGSCSCTCASGGLSERDIERANEARKTDMKPNE